MRPHGVRFCVTTLRDRFLFALLVLPLAMSVQIVVGSDLTRLAVARV
jgi:hypothetical protein